MRHTSREPRPRRRLPRLLRFPIRILSSALIISLALFFLPYLTRLAGRLWPDPARTQKVSEILSHELKESARLETMTVDDEGVLTATVQAALIGEVQRVTITYDYHASVGVDLNKVSITADGGVLTLVLPPFEILSDSLTPVTVDRDDFWYPLTESRRAMLLSEERAARAQAVLSEVESSDEIWHRTVATLEGLIRSWIGADTWLITVDIQREALPDAAPEKSAGLRTGDLL